MDQLIGCELIAMMFFSHNYQTLFKAVVTVSLLFAPAIAQDDEVLKRELAKRFSLEETEQEGNWAEQSATLTDTPEAPFVWRFGDVDNFDQTWRIAHNPFSGEIASPLDLQSQSISKRRGPTDLGFNLKGDETSPPTLEASFDLSPLPSSVSTFSIQFYLMTNGQAPKDNSWIAKINGIEQEGLANLLNQMEMKPHQGYLITWHFPVSLFAAPSETLKIGLGFKPGASPTAFAVDFFKVLGEPKAYQFSKTITGTVRTFTGGKPIPNVEVTCQGRTAFTDSKGKFKFENCAAGSTLVSVGDKRTEMKTLNLYSKNKYEIYFLK